MRHFPVLIVGGGPVGLTASILLSRLGVPSLVAERHPGTAIHPKARGINPRTMEIFRQAGVEEAVRAAGLPPERTGFIVWTRTLAGEEIERRRPSRTASVVQGLSPARNCVCAQDDLEPVLRRHAEAQSIAEVRFGSEVTALAPDADGVTATLLERAGGVETRIRADFVIAADGAQSRTRTGLGIAMEGRENVYESVNILFRADLTRWTVDRPAALYFVENPKVRATFLTINGTDRWGLLVNNLSAYGYRPEEFTPERCVEMVRLAAGVPDLAVEVLGISPWTAAARVAARYRQGRVLLAGDAAHEMPPTGGFGLNTGVGDVHNLAWKIAAVLAGHAGDGLLDTYDAERRPAGRLITEQSLVNTMSMGRTDRRVTGPVTARPEYLNEQGLIFGITYESRAVVPDGSPAPDLTDPVTQYVPSGRPGGRAPHVWLGSDGGAPSTLDAIDGFTLFTGPGGRAWREEAERASQRRRLPIGRVTLGDGGEVSAGGGSQSLLGIDADGAVLVRPDGYVAWRARSAPAANVGTGLDAALSRILARDP